MSIICDNCCNYTCTEVVQLVYKVYNLFVGANFDTFEQKKCAVLNLYQDKIVNCLNLSYAHKFEVSSCGQFQYLFFIATIGTYAINLVVYFDGYGYVLLNQGSYRLRYENCKNVADSVVTRDVVKYPSVVTDLALCEAKTGVLYCYDKKCDKVSSRCGLVRNPFVKILSPKKCQNIDKSVCVRFNVVDFDFCAGNTATVFVDDVEFIVLNEVLPVTVHFKCEGKHSIAIKLWDNCCGMFVAEAKVDVKICDSSSSTSCTTTDTSSSSSCQPCKSKVKKSVKKVAKDTSSSDSSSDTDTFTSESCSLYKTGEGEKQVKKVTCYKSDSTDQ